MPFSSHQVNSLMSGQQAMFGNIANFSSQIGPGGRGGSMYASPMAFGEHFMNTLPPPMYNQMAYNMGPHAMAGLASAAQSAIPMAALAGSFLPGAAGRAFSMLDPTSAAIGGFARGSGLLHGVHSGAGLMETFGGVVNNMGRIASGGFGNIMRAGIAGVGAGLVSMAPAMAITEGVRYVGGQMVQGAQHTNQVQSILQSNFRHLNSNAATGFGFSREEGASIASMIRGIAGQDMMTSLPELTRIMEQGVQGGLFRAVQDAKTFKDKFKELHGSLKEIAKSMNTTLSGAMEFYKESRHMGFWSPSDILRATTVTRSAANASGLSIAETQQAMNQGAMMARSVGAAGYTGALGMSRTIGMVGGGLRSGVISAEQLHEVTGMEGPEAIASFAGTLQAGATRFASSRQARWLLASLANKDFTGLDRGKLAGLVSGNMSLGDIRDKAEGRVSGHGNAAGFLLGEEQMRGSLISQGPEAQLGFVRGIIGDKLHGGSNMDRYVTRRLIQRYMGVNAREADMLAELARGLPKTVLDNAERDLNLREQEQRNTELMMQHSWEGTKRRASKWLETNIGTPLQNIGANISEAIGTGWERMTDTFWGRPVRGSEIRGVTGIAAENIRGGIMGGGLGMPRMATNKTMDQLNLDMKRHLQNITEATTVKTVSMAGIGSIMTSKATVNTTDLESLQSNPQFARALAAFQAGESMAGERMLTDLTRDKTLSNSQRKAVGSLLDSMSKGGEEGKTVREALTAMGGTLMEKQSAAYTETVSKRMGEAVKSIGGEMGTLVTSLNAVKGGGGMGDTLKSLLTGNFDAGSRQPLMQKLIAQSSKADSKSLSKALEVLPDIPQLAGLRRAIAMGQDASSMLGLTGAGGKGLQAINRIQAEIGGQITEDVMSDLQGKHGREAQMKAREGLLAGKSGTNLELEQQLITAIQDPSKGGFGKRLYDIRSKQAAMAGFGVTQELAANKKLSPAEALGQLGHRGSLEGIHDTLTRSLDVLKQISESKTVTRVEDKSNG